MHTNSPLQARAPGPPTPRLGDRKAIHELEEVVKLKHEESDGPHLVATQLYTATPTRAKPLVDNRHDIRCCTLSPRHGSFTVDSASWFEELKRDPFHACSNMPLSVLLTGYMLVYFLAIIGHSFMESAADKDEAEI
mmetsp:Transcript_43995/g.142808  ORF Transcript_43995/g.142808 Transcript_43995/m.142808 type:complete len:136 (-) Transcript_43995:320-727(-)